MTLQECEQNVGRRVTYIPFKDCEKRLYEYGTITSVNSTYAFVKFDKDFGSKSCKPENLKLGTWF